MHVKDFLNLLPRLQSVSLTRLFLGSSVLLQCSPLDVTMVLKSVLDGKGWNSIEEELIVRTYRAFAQRHWNSFEATCKAISSLLELSNSSEGKGKASAEKIALMEKLSQMMLSLLPQVRPDDTFPFEILLEWFWYQNDTKSIDQVIQVLKQRYHEVSHLRTICNSHVKTLEDFCRRIPESLTIPSIRALIQFWSDLINQRLILVKEDIAARSSSRKIPRTITHNCDYCIQLQKFFDDRFATQIDFSVPKPNRDHIQYQAGSDVDARTENMHKRAFTLRLTKNRSGLELAQREHESLTKALETLQKIISFTPIQSQEETTPSKRSKS